MLEVESEVTVQIAGIDDAPLVRALMLAGFAQFKDTLDPPSSAFWKATRMYAAIARVEARQSPGLRETPVGSVRFEPQGACPTLGGWP
ncbi:MAG: hypothetical protein R2855_02695 [Thermomicrobiales bacterium]